jgi:hypothetical protein
MADMMTFGNLKLHTAGGRVRITGPDPYVDALRMHLASCGIEAAVRHQAWEDTASLEVRAGANPKRVETLLDRWTD